MPTSIVFLGSKPIGYRCLDYLIQHSAALNIEVKAVCTQQRSEFGTGFNLQELATKNNITVVDDLNKIPECDIIYSVQHHQILKANHIERARKIAVNLHLAPLPEYRGCNQFSFAIMDEAREFGVSVHEIDARIDHGDLLFEDRFSMPKDCWVSDLYELSIAAGFKLFCDTLPDLISGNYHKISQEELARHRGSSLHFRNEIKSLKVIDLDSPAATIEKTIRATYMPGFEGPYTMIAGRKFYFRES